MCENFNSTSPTYVCVSLMLRYQSTIIIAISSTHFLTQLPFDRSQKSTRVQIESIYVLSEKRRQWNLAPDFWGMKEPTISMIGYHSWMKFYLSLRDLFPNASNAFYLEENLVLSFNRFIRKKKFKLIRYRVSMKTEIRRESTSELFSKLTLDDFFIFRSLSLLSFSRHKNRIEQAMDQAKMRF